MRAELIAIPGVTMPGLASNYRRQEYRSFYDNLLHLLMHCDSLSRHNVPPTPRTRESPATPCPARPRGRLAWTKVSLAARNELLSEKTESVDRSSRPHAFFRGKKTACVQRAAKVGANRHRFSLSLSLSRTLRLQNLAPCRPQRLFLSLSLSLSIICKCRTTDTVRCRHKFSPGVKRVCEP